MKTYSFEEMKDKYVGVLCTPERDSYEYALRIEILKRRRKQAPTSPK